MGKTSYCEDQLIVRDNYKTATLSGVGFDPPTRPCAWSTPSNTAERLSQRKKMLITTIINN